MVKETERTTRKTTVKKTRRKSETSGSENSATTSTPTMPSKSGKELASNAATKPAAPVGDVYKRVVEFEEAEAQYRNAEKDEILFIKVCDDISTYMKEINELKKINTEQAKAEIVEKRISASLLFVALKKLNRLEKFRTKTSRDTMNKVKLQVDSYHLQLQNLLYETLHLQKEVTKCLEFKSKDEEIDLVSVREFYKEAPESISRPAETKDNPHLQKLARLEWELEQRKQLAIQCSEKDKTKETVAAAISSKSERLESLAPQLRSILEATKPLQDYLGMPIDKIRRQHQVASLLPKPLYILYVQADAYREACDSLLTVFVSGDEEEARQQKTQLQVNELDESDSDQEIEPQEEVSEGQSRRHRKMSRVDRLEQRRKHLLMKHPLNVEINIKLKGFAEHLSLTFFYLVNLHVVTVQCKVTLVHPTRGISAGDLLSPRTLLSALLPGDFGEDSPNPANHYQLHNVGLDRFVNYVEELGHPYRWAQHVAGLDFMKGTSVSKNGGRFTRLEPLTSVSQSCIQNIIHAIRYRFKARIALGRQVQMYETGSIPVQACLKPLFPSELGTKIMSWQPACWADYKVAGSTQRLVQDEAVNDGDTLYRAAFSRGSAKLIALIAVKPHYPKVPPVFSLNLHWNGERNSSNDDAIRDMEREVNVYWEELVVGHGPAWGLLSTQILRLMSCLDVYLEAMGSKGVAPPEFPRDKVFLKPVRGRNRSLPYKYLQIGGGVFTQR